MAAVEDTCGRDGLPKPTAAHITATLPLMLDMELQDLMFALLALGLSFPQPPLCHHSSLSEWGGVDSVSWYTGSVQFLYFLGAHS